jgi:hypothetical protein
VYRLGILLGACRLHVGWVWRITPASTNSWIFEVNPSSACEAPATSQWRYQSVSGGLKAAETSTSDSSRRTGTSRSTRTAVLLSPMKKASMTGSACSGWTEL